MEEIFLSVLNMSLTASFVITAIILARFPLKKAPKIISYVLWAVAGFRLVFPFTLESMFSLIPFKAAPIPRDIAMQAVPRINSGITIIDNAVSASLPAANPVASVNPLQVLIFIGSCIWIFGVAVMLVYSLVSIVLLKRRLCGAALIKGNLYEADNLKTPFVIGLFKPKIYIPSGLTDEERCYIILHEQTHIRRGDHVAKMLAYFILCLHWFNPLAWVAFILMGADMEMSCDERVMRDLGREIKNAYSLSLVRVAAGHKILNGSPLAFSESGMKERIKNVLNFKKPSRVIITVSIALVTMLSVGFAVNQSSDGSIWDRLWPMTMKDLTKHPHFRGVVTEVHDGSVLVLVNEDEDERSSSDLLNVSLNVKLKDSTTDLYIGDEILVSYDGMITETYPAGVHNVYGIALLNRNAPIIEWVNYYGDKASSTWSDYAEITTPHFPDSVFRWTAGEVTVADTSGERVLFTGMPIWNVFLADVTGDGLPEFCATLSMGSGIVDTHILAYDYAGGASYEYSNRAVYDYSLSLEDGRLMVTQREYIGGSVIAMGTLEFLNGAVSVPGLKDDGQPTVTPEPSPTTPQDAQIAKKVEDGLNIIMSSPLTSSNPQDYINEHNEEYENLTAKYPDGVLEYLLSQFEAGNTDGLRGQIMMHMCKDMLGLQNNVTDETLSPQKWYEQLSIISEIELPDFKPENPMIGVDDGAVDGKVYGSIFNSAIVQHYGNSERGFLVYSPTIYGAYEEESKLKVFVTVDYQYYRLYGKTLEQTGGGVIPGAIVFTKEELTGSWIFEEYLEVGTRSLPDGAYFGDSMKKLCVMPVSGDEITGLADEMNSDYVSDMRRELLAQSLREHLMSQGQVGVSLKTPGGEMVPLT